MEPNDAASTSARAHELRASLGARRELEALLAEASATREAAVSDADAIIEEAQQVSDQLLRESRSEAERVSTDARLRAEGVVSRARNEAEDITRQARAAADAVRARAEAQVEEHRRRVRAELTEQVTREVTEQSQRELARLHERQQSTIGDLEASVRILGVSMEAAVANIAEMLSSLDSLRAHTAESLGDAHVPLTTRPRHAEDADPVDEQPDDHSDDHSGDHSTDNPDDRRDDQPDDHVDDVSDDGSDASHDQSDGEGHEEPDEDDDEDEDDRGATTSGGLVDALAELDPDDEPPLTATEAFLRSAHVDHGDPPLPPVDDADIGARYARDAMRATARARTRRDEETLDVVPGARHNGTNGPDERDERKTTDDAGGEATEASGKPLGWLFRSSS